MGIDVFKLLSSQNTYTYDEMALMVSQTIGLISLIGFAVSLILVLANLKGKKDKRDDYIITTVLFFIFLIFAQFKAFTPLM